MPGVRDMSSGRGEGGGLAASARLSMCIGAGLTHAVAAIISTAPIQ